LVSKPAAISAFVIALSLLWALPAQAVIVDANDTAWLSLDAGQAVTCIALYVPDVVGIPETLVFSQPPVFISDAGFFGDFTDWQTAISPDQKMVWLYGPRSANEFGVNDVPWFKYQVFWQWDNTDPDLDPTYPVYVDMAFFDGPFGSPSWEELSWKGLPGGWPDNWVGPTSSMGGPYTNPAPEPATVFLLGTGLLLVLRTRHHNRR